MGKKKGSKAKAKALAKKEGGGKNKPQGTNDIDALRESMKRLSGVWNGSNAELLAQVETFATAAARARGHMTAAASPLVADESGECCFFQLLCLS
jgi:hypothetical protein